jgi:hypothetical protein
MLLPSRNVSRSGPSSIADPVSFIPPGLIVAVLLVLITSQLFFALLPFRRRSYVPILLLTAVGFGLGQLWDFIGLPSLRLGEADVIPAVLFALLLQPLARFVPRPKRAAGDESQSREQKPPKPAS